MTFNGRLTSTGPTCAATRRTPLYVCQTNDYLFQRRVHGFWGVRSVWNVPGRLNTRPLVHLPIRQEVECRFRHLAVETS